jgi:hypothetical protein
MTGMKIKKSGCISLLLGTLLSAAGCNVISFFPHKAAEVAADKVIDDTLPRENASAGAPTQRAATTFPAHAPQKP